MPSTGLWNDLVAILVVPIAVWIIATGFGLLVERLLRIRLADGLLAPVGFCLSMIVSLAVFSGGVGDPVAVPIVVVLALVGIALARRELPGRVRGCWPLLAGLCAYVLFNVSVIATGHWTFTGYNIENDSAYELLLTAHLQLHGTQGVAATTSTANFVINQYLSTGYPLGSQSLLAVVSGLLGVDPAVAWQSFISTMAGFGAMAAATLSGRTMDRRVGAIVGLVAVAAALTYQYALLGAIKEIAVVATMLCALATVRYAILALRGVGAVVVCAIPIAAILVVYNGAGAPYAASIAAAGVLGVIFVHRRMPGRSWVKPGLAGLLALAVCAVPMLLVLGEFLHSVVPGYTGSSPTAPVLGPLFRALPLSQISGVWLSGEFRLPISPGKGAVLTAAITAVIFCLLAPAVLRLVRAREPGPLMGLLVIVLVELIASPRVTPYAQAKLLAIDSPIVLLCAAQALSAPRSWDWRGLCALAGIGLAVAVVVSDAMTYHTTPVAPTTRLIALRQVGERLGEKGPVLDSEFEQFAKYFTRPSLLIDGPDAPTPIALELNDPALAQYDNSFDLDQEKLPFVESFPYVLTRRSPATSRPPANYRLIFSNAFYEVWRRQAQPRVYEHLPLGGTIDAAGSIGCRSLRADVSKAPKGSALAVASPPAVYGFTIEQAEERSPGWAPGGTLPGGVLTITPGSARGTIQVAAPGRYRVWVQGDMPRPVTVSIDGRRLGAVSGADTPGGWLSAGSAHLSSGRHVLEVARGGGSLAPGNGNTQASIGAVAVSAEAPETIRRVALGDWRSLCGRQADWVEVIG